MMQEFFSKYKKIIIRSTGSLMLLLGFVIHFWVTPKEGVSDLDIAAANVARMEASVRGEGQSSQERSQQAPLLQEFKNSREKQMEYLTIIAMVLGGGFLVYSFLQKEF